MPIDRSLTARFVETVRTELGRQEFRDRDVDGLELRVTRAGTKTWCVRYRRQSDQRKRVLTLGRYPAYSLREARDLAREARRVIARGGDPAGEKQLQKTAETFRDLADAWLTEHCAHNLRPRSCANYRTVLALHIYPRIGDMKARAVTRRDVALVLSDAVRARDYRFSDRQQRATRPRVLPRTRRASANPNRVFATMRAAYRWALRQGIIEHDPTWGMAAPLAEPKPRTRVLTPRELQRLWYELDATTLRRIDRILFRLALVTAQRVGEVASMHRDHLALHGAHPVWTVPGANTKNGVEHKVWLSPLAVALIEEAQQLHASEWVFPLAHGAGPLRTPNVVDAWKSARVMLQMPDVRPHDLRRTAATALGELGVPDRDIEAVLNHVSAGRTVTRRHYDFAQREEQKRNALLLWGEQLRETISRESDGAMHDALCRDVSTFVAT